MNTIIMILYFILMFLIGMYLGYKKDKKRNRIKEILENTTKYVRLWERHKYNGKEYILLIIKTNKENVLMQEIFDAHLVIKNNILIKNNPEITGYKKEIGTKFTNQELIKEFGFQASLIL